MLCILGGASRAGKSTLAGRMLERHGMSWFGLDLLRMGLFRGAPQLGLDPGRDCLEEADRLWPIVHEMCERLLSDGRPYLIEGTCLRPSDLVVYAAMNRDRVRISFLGYADLTAEAKLAQMRDHPVDEHNWLRRADEGFVRQHVDYSIGFSRRVRDECRLVGAPYSDTGADFEGSLAKVERYFSGQ